MKLKYIDDFHKERKGKLGSSDIPTLAGLNLKYGKSTFTLWQEKLGIIEGFTGNEATYWGHRHEINILYKYIENLTTSEIAQKWLIKRLQGKNKFKADGYEFHSNTVAEQDDFVAHADLVVRHPDKSYSIQEAKSLRLYASKIDESGEFGYSNEIRTLEGIPLSVYLQIQFQMKLYGIKKAGVSALIDTSDYREYGTGDIDNNTIDKISKLCDVFMYHVKNNIPPKVELWSDVVSMFPVIQENASIIKLDEKLDNGIQLSDILEKREILKSKIKEQEKEIDDIDNAIGLLIGNNTRLQTPKGDVLVTCSESERESLSLKTLQEKEPEIFNKIKEKNLINVSKFRRLYYKKLKQIGE